LLREALVRLFKKRGNLNVRGAVPYTPDVLRSIGSSGADALVLDSMTALLSDRAVIPEILRQNPKIKIALIDMENDPEVFLGCVRAGALGYFLGDASATEVVSGVELVAEGRAVCHPRLCMHLFRAFSQQWSAGPTVRIKLEFDLTRRQQEIVPLIAQGLSNKEIADQLNLSQQTVKNHIHRIMRRVGASDRTEVSGLANALGQIN
jgi:DNA-binding NarL/FixJ family response regulator